MSLKNTDNVVPLFFKEPLYDGLFEKKCGSQEILRDTLEVSDSVLSKHIKHLETAGYVSQRKGSADGRKRSWVYLRGEGRKAFRSHVKELQRLIKV